MTLHEPDIRQAHLSGLPHFAEAHRVSRPLTSVACIDAAAIAVLCAVVTGLGPAAWQPGLVVLQQTGAVGVVLAALGLALGTTICCLVMLGIRRRGVAMPERSRRNGIFSRLGWRRAGVPAVGLLAQVLVMTAACVGSIAALVAFRAQTAEFVPATATWFALAGVSMLAAFPLLIAERVLAAIPVARLPELPHLKPFAVLPIACLVVFAATDVAAGLGLDLTGAVTMLLATGIAVVAAELVLRAGVALLLPAPDRVQARSPVDSLLLRSLGLALGRRTSWSSVMRERFGIDFARSWALRYVRRAAAPIVAVLVLFCIFLTGVSRIDANERGVYERFGLPVAVLRPGLHLILPWPFGQIRRTEYGVVHAVPISYGDAHVAADALLRALSAGTEMAGADGPAPASANRLWDSEQDTDVSYIISSNSRGRQSFETISVSVRVLWRIGLDDASARRAVYAVTDHDTVVRTLAGQLLARYLASRTLPQLLGEDHASITRSLQTGLQQMLDGIGSGIDIVSVIVEAIHPPGGAADAYRNVQAAEIAANTAISAERGQAETTASLARRDAADAIAAATAAAAERLSAAEVMRTNLRSDAAAYRDSGGPFMLERYLAQLATSLRTASVEILDHRLGVSAGGASNGDALGGPTLDLRPFERIGEASAPRNGRAAGNGDSAP